MQMVMQLASRLFRLGYAEIWNMCTLNAARALDLGHDRGSLEPGKRADVVLWNVPCARLWPSIASGVNLVHKVFSTKKEKPWQRNC